MNSKLPTGFTLIESLVAVTILTLAIAGPLYAASRAVVATQNARDRLTASYLAQEGIEVVRVQRDNKYLFAYGSNPATASSAGWINFLTSVASCKNEATCTISFSSCGQSLPTTCTLYLKSTSPIYYSQSSSAGPATKFSRTIQIKDTSDNNDKQVVSTVSWDFHGTTYSVAITDHLTPWQ